MLRCASVGAPPATPAWICRYRNLTCPAAPVGTGHASPSAAIPPPVGPRLHSQSKVAAIFRDERLIQVARKIRAWTTSRSCGVPILDGVMGFCLAVLAVQERTCSGGALLQAGPGKMFTIMDDKRVEELMQRAVTLAARSISEDRRRHPLVGAVLSDLDGAILLEMARGEVAPGIHAEGTAVKGEEGEGIEALRSTVLASGSDSQFAKEEPFRWQGMHGALHDFDQGDFITAWRRHSGWAATVPIAGWL